MASSFNDLLVEVPKPGSPLEKQISRCGSSAEIFNISSLGQGIVGSRLLMATPAILTGFGVLGTFVGLAMGIGGLNLGAGNIEDLDKSISPLIKGSSTAFVTSVWGVGVSILFTLLEKLLEHVAVSRIRKTQSKFDLLVPRYTPEESMIALDRSSASTERMIKGLAVAIGEEMQRAMNRIGDGITSAVKEALGGQAQDLGKMGAELMSKALTEELTNLQTSIGGMSENFRSEFNATSERLTAAITGFDNILTGVNSTVESSREAMDQAVGRLSAHDEVVAEIRDGATMMKEAAGKLESMRETFTHSAEKNVEAATAQEKAASKNELVAGRFDLISEKLPEVQEAVSSGAKIIASLGQPLLDLKDILDKTPEIFGQQAEEQATRDERRSSLLLEQTEKLANTVAVAADKFSQIETLASSLGASARNLENAGTSLGNLAENINSASVQHATAAQAAEKAALAGERAAARLEPIPDSLVNLSGTLEAASGTIKEGADAARDVYQELLRHQKQ